MRRKYQQLSKNDRINIHTLLFRNKTQKEITQELKVHPSTISLNNRPRKTLQFNTPNEVFFANFMPNKKIALGG